MKKYILFLFIFFLSLGGVYASTSAGGKIGELFVIATNDSNGSTETQYRLDGKNIQDGTIEGDKISTGTIQQINISSNLYLWKQSGGLIYSEENVGIGTSNPISKLEINGNVNINSGSIFVGDKKVLLAPKENCNGEKEVIQFQNGELKCITLVMP